MTTVNDIAQDRWFVDPREASAQKGDYVTLSDHNILWEVTSASKVTGMVYLRSVDGRRFGIESTARLKSIWRDPNGIVEIDWNEYTDEEEDVD